LAHLGAQMDVTYEDAAIFHADIYSMKSPRFLQGFSV